MLIYKMLFSDDLGIDTKPLPDGLAVLEALIVGTLIPILSSIIPIRKAMGINLNDALDY